MTFSYLTGRVFPTTKQGPRAGGRSVERLIVHHCAGTGDEGMVRYLSGAGGGTSATYCLTTGPELVGIVPEELRPWTSNAVVGGIIYDNDSNAVTVETVNSSGAPEWHVTDGQVEYLSLLAADLCIRYDWGRVDRGRVVGHREVLPGGYTACPGPYLYPLLDYIVERANALIDGEPTPAKPQYEEDEEMNTYYEATDNSDPIEDSKGNKYSRIWAGNREINGQSFSNVWERPSTGPARRLFAGEPEALKAAHAALNRPFASIPVRGNVIEAMVHGKR